LAVGIQNLVDSIDGEARLALSSDGPGFSPLAAFPVGIGEEAYFRGYLQTMIAEATNPWAGIITSSLLFGAVHIPNARAFGLSGKEEMRYYTTVIPMISAFGAYFGWLTYKNCSLKESTAVHSWYDFTLFLAASSASSSLAIGKPTLSFSFAF